MNMEKAIKQAMKGGWQRYKTKQPTIVAGLDMEGLWNVEDRDELFAMEDAYLIQEALLDPLFWQALGKAEGRNKVCESCGEGFLKSRDNCLCGESSPPLTSWYEYTMHRFIDHLIAEKPIDDFFNNLLTNTQ